MIASSAIPLYLDALRLAKKSDNTLRTYRHALRQFSRIVGEGAELDEKSYIKFLQAIARRTDKAQITYRVPVARLYQYHAPEVPVKLLTEQYGQKKRRSLPEYKEEAVDRILDFADSLRGDLLAIRDRAFILTLADTGLRISEACSLTRGDIDFEKSRALIVGKGDKPGVVRFSPRSLSAIRYYLSARAELDGKSGRALSTLPLFARHDPGAGKKVKPVTSKGMGAAFGRRMSEAGIEKGVISPHKLRHYFVTRILRAKTGGLVKAQELARHESIMTTRRYGHLAPAEIDKTYKEIFGE